LVAWLGLSSKWARVNVRAPGVSVTILGDREQAKRVLAVVKEELERSHRRRAIGRQRSAARMPSSARIMEPSVGTDSQVVRPTDLDEMDSPYAIPEHRTRPTADKDDGPATVEEDFGDTSTHDIRDTIPADDLEEPDREVTAVDVNLGPSAAPQRVEVLFPESERATVPPLKQRVKIAQPVDTAEATLTPRAPSRARDPSDPHRG